MKDLRNGEFVAGSLQGHAGHPSVRTLLEELAVFAAASMRRSTGIEKIEVVITLHREHHAIVAAGSSAAAGLIEEAEQSYGEGPGFVALETQSTVLIGDTRKDSRWDGFADFLETEGYRSVLAIPIPAVPDSSAVVCLFTPVARAFNLAAVSAAEDFAEHAGLTLREAVTSSSLELTAQDSGEAAESRRIIDLACGAIMAQNRCSQSEALKTLTHASRNRKQKVLNLAEEFLHSLVSGSDQTVLGSPPSTSDG
jgi:GAF domain-containing protein